MLSSDTTGSYVYVQTLPSTRRCQALGSSDKHVQMPIVATPICPLCRTDQQICTHDFSGVQDRMSPLHTVVAQRPEHRPH